MICCGGKELGKEEDGREGQTDRGGGREGEKETEREGKESGGDK